MAEALVTGGTVELCERQGTWSLFLMTGDAVRTARTLGRHLGSDQSHTTKAESDLSYRQEECDEKSLEEARQQQQQWCGR